MHMSDATTLAMELARAIYRLTDDLPETEPLRIKLREVALDIAAKKSSEAAYAVRVMSTLLCVARAQGFAREENFALLDRAYGELKELRRHEEEPAQSLRSEPPSGVSRIEPSPVSRLVPNDSSQARSEEIEGIKQPETLSTRDDAGVVGEAKLKTLNPRQKKMIQHFHYRQAFQLREARALFQGYSQKTLRNDLRSLCLKGILNREGVGTTSFYRVVVKMPNS